MRFLILHPFDTQIRQRIRPCPSIFSIHSYRVNDQIEYMLFGRPQQQQLHIYSNIEYDLDIYDPKLSDTEIQGALVSMRNLRFIHGI